MSRRATLAAAVVAALLAAAPAAAQEDATPIVGGGSFTDAPIVEPGTYRDTVLPEEYLYYGVNVGAGQRLRVTMNVGLTPEELSDLSIAGVTVNLHGPDRSYFFDRTGPQSTSGIGTEPSDVITDAALPVSETRDSVANSWVGPGVYFIAIYPVFVGAQELPKAEIPVTFKVALEGQAQSEPAPTPSPSPSPTPTATVTATAKASPPPEEDSTPMAAAGAGVAGLLIGVVGGIALRRQRRR